MYFETGAYLCRVYAWRKAPGGTWYLTIRSLTKLKPTADQIEDN